MFLFEKAIAISESDIDEKEQISSNDKLIKCYLENETKEYLTARKWIRGELIDLYNDLQNQIKNKTEV